MRKLIHTRLVFAGLLFATDLMAQSQKMEDIAIESSSFLVNMAPIANTQDIRILVSKKSGTKFRLKVSDSNEHVVYEGYMTQKATQKYFKLNLGELEDGNYLFEMNDNKQTNISKTISKQNIILANPIAITGYLAWMD